MIKTHRAVVWTLLALLFSTAAAAAELAGMVKNSSGQVSIERAGQRLAAAVGTPIHVTDKLRTGADGAVGVTLRDNTLLSAGPNSLISIDKFVFDTTSQAGNISVGIRKGTLSVASGKIAKQTPESVDFRTPTSVLGVRGTEFVIEVEGGHED
ncbi:MAG: FecR domain-containing protein [Azonexus sp.]